MHMSSKLIAKLPGAKHVCYFIINAIIVYLTKPLTLKNATNYLLIYIYLSSKVYDLFCSMNFVDATHKDSETFSEQVFNGCTIIRTKCYQNKWVDGCTDQRECII